MDPFQESLPTAAQGQLQLRDLHKQFLAEQHFGARLSAETIRLHRTAVAQFMNLMPQVRLAELSTSTVVEFFRRLESRSRWSRRGEKRGVKTTTLASYRSKLSAFFSWLERKGEIKHNPIKDLPAPRVEYIDRKFLARATVERILACLLVGRRWRTQFARRRNVALFATLLYAGLRRNELVCLRVTDLDLRRLELTIRGETSKSRMTRQVPINHALLMALEDYLSERTKRGHRSEFLFTSSSGDRPFTKEGLKHLVDQVQAASGERFHLHQFRHTFAVNFLNRGGDIAKLKQLLGHRDIRMTALYLRCLPISALRADVESVTLDTLL